MMASAMGVRLCVRRIHVNSLDAVVCVSVGTGGISRIQWLALGSDLPLVFQRTVPCAERKILSARENVVNAPVIHSSHATSRSTAIAP